MAHIQRQQRTFALHLARIGVQLPTKRSVRFLPSLFFFFFYHRKWFSEICRADFYHLDTFYNTIVTLVCIYVCMYVSVSVRLYVCMYVCIYVCMDVYMEFFILKIISKYLPVG